jgi:hypothetical protein
MLCPCVGKAVQFGPTTGQNAQARHIVPNNGPRAGAVRPES